MDLINEFYFINLKNYCIMSHHRDEDNFNDYTLPTFLEGNLNRDIVIELGEGDYTLDYNLLIHQHNVIIKGQGSTKTRLIVPANIDYADDAIIELLGAQGHEIAVSISGLTINASVTKAQADAASTDLTQNESHIIKCYHVKSFYMHDVRIIAENLKTTCLDIRRGSNIIIRGNEFVNYNRRWTGGGIWLRGDIENVIIEDNDFYKYGNDEVIAIYGSNNFVGVNESDEISKRNVEIRYNRFYCQDSNGGQNVEGIINETGGSWHGSNERFITVFTNQDDNKEKINGVYVQRTTPCHQTINGIHLCNNEFNVNAPLSHLLTVAFDKFTTYKDVTVKNNIINYGNWIVEGLESNKKELIDFCIYYDTDYAASVLIGNYNGSCDEPFFITGNTLTCGTNVRNIRTNGGNEFYVDNHIIVEIKGTKVIFDENNILCTRESYTADEKTFANKGVELFHSGDKGGEIMFSRNHCEGLKNLMSLTRGSATIPIGRIWGCGNYLQGDTRIHYLNTVESHVFMKDNEIIADYPVFFLQEFANIGTVVFIGNRVYRDLTRATFFTTPYGHIYYTGTSGSENNIVSMKLICCDNVFDNLNAQYMYSYLQNGTMRTVHKNNIFADMFE